MIAIWMLYGTVIALFAGLGAAALERGARLLGKAGRWCWVGAMIVTIALPVVAWYRPQVLQPLPIAMLTSNAIVAAAQPVTITAPSIWYHSWSWSELDRPLTVAWGLLSLGLLAWFAGGAWRLARLRKAWHWNGDLFVSTDVGPAVVGFLRCQVVVPEWSFALGVEQRELLLAHEAEHLAAYDSRLLWCSAILLALVPWNIGFWWQFRRLRLAIELDCDSRVLRRRPDRAAYGRLLLDVGIRAAHTLLPVTAFHEPVSNLERRILSMTAKRPKGAGWLAAVLAMGAAVAVFFACEAPRPTAPRSGDGVLAQATMVRDSVAVPPWVREAMAKYYPELVAGRSTAPAEVWFAADGEHHVLQSTLRTPGSVPGTSLGVMEHDNVANLFPGLHSGTIQSITPGGWPAENVRVVWVTVGASPTTVELRERERHVDSVRTEEEARLGSGRESERRTVGPAQAELRERSARDSTRTFRKD